nr:MAG TPA: hypothetical protein [Caudoviricetes sp.]
MPSLNGDVFERCNDYGIRSLYKDYETSTFKVKVLVWKCRTLIEILSEEIVYSPNKYLVTEGIKEIKRNCM